MDEVLFHPEAKDEYSSAYSWYFERSERSADDFEVAFDKALHEIANAPLRWHPVDRRHRTHLLERFPYQIIYRVIGNKVVVIAVAHAKRQPGYWKERN